MLYVRGVPFTRERSWFNPYSGDGFSKWLENHCASISLYVAFYNLCRVHEALRTTPAVALGITDHTWSIAELIERRLRRLSRQSPRRSGGGCSE
jgi:hypothetical protein